MKLNSFEELALLKKQEKKSKKVSIQMPSKQSSPIEDAYILSMKEAERQKHRDEVKAAKKKIKIEEKKREEERSRLLAAEEARRERERIRQEKILEEKRRAEEARIAEEKRKEEKRRIEEERRIQRALEKERIAELQKKKKEKEIEMRKQAALRHQESLRKEEEQKRKQQEDLQQFIQDFSSRRAQRLRSEAESDRAQALKREEEKQTGSHEELVDVVRSISTCAQLRAKTEVTVSGRAHCLVNGEYETFWFTPESYFQFGWSEELKNMGRFVYRNAHEAIKIQTTDLGGTYKSLHENKIHKLEQYEVLVENKADFQNRSISIAGDSIYQYQYRNIDDFLCTLRENAEEIEDVKTKIQDLEIEYKRLEETKGKKESATERTKITKTINSYKETYRILTDQQEDLKNITIYIREQGKMRYVLIVDTIQTRIKSQNLYDGQTIIINGGPGTGKTTTMIHRLGYLTDKYAIEEDFKKKQSKYELTYNQRRKLYEAIDSERDWMFFSPSQMLKEYLAQAMVNEGLKNTSLKVWNWRDYCRQILQTDYHLLENGEVKAPFKNSNVKEALFYQNSGVIKEFTDYFISSIRDSIESLPKFKEDGPKYKWIAISKSIKERLDNARGYDLSHYVLMFDSLEHLYNDSCKSILKDNRQNVTTLAELICDMVNENKKIKSDIDSLLKIAVVDEEETTEETEEQEDSNSQYLNRKIQTWIKQYSYTLVDEKGTMSPVMSLLSEIILPMVGNTFQDEFQKIGDLAIFEQYAKFTNGVRYNIFNGLSEKYKGYRKLLLASQRSECNLKVLKNLIHENQGKYLHFQEQSLLLGFINNLVKIIKAVGISEIKHDFIIAFDELSRPIIGVDEATDFCDCDIYAMHSLLSPDFNSFTLCGDMMQRMTDYGIKSWNELDDYIPDTKVVEMKTSYRQSRKLLEVARSMYQDTIGSTPNYKAYMKSKKVPDPLVYISSDEFSKITWIEKRIEEVYRAYGETLPSIAIFVNDKGEILRFAERLQSTEFFTSKNIEVLDGTKPNSSTEQTHICVYPIDEVKGMEFDVVFFHNIDKTSADNEMLKRYIYVGVSRAAFFLGITLIEDNPELSKYFASNKDWFKI